MKEILVSTIAQLRREIWVVPTFFLIHLVFAGLVALALYLLVDAPIAGLSLRDLFDWFFGSNAFSFLGLCLLNIGNNGIFDGLFNCGHGRVCCALWFRFRRGFRFRRLFCYSHGNRCLDLTRCNNHLLFRINKFIPINASQ